MACTEVEVGEVSVDQVHACNTDRADGCRAAASTVMLLVQWPAADVCCNRRRRVRKCTHCHTFAAAGVSPTPPAASLLAAGSAQVLVDWGGATGALAAAACSMYPELSAVVLDLPHVVDKARQHFSQRPAVLVGVLLLCGMCGTASDFPAYVSLHCCTPRG